MPVLFYVAVHELQAFFVDCGLRPVTHKQRESILRLPPNALKLGPTLRRRYARLETDSRAARYECVVHSPQQLDAAEVALADVRAVLASLGTVTLARPQGVPSRR
jgi:hypothetical protein